VQPCQPLAVLFDPDEGVAVLELLGSTPLLQLADKVRRIAGLRMPTSENDVGPLGCERELILEEHLNILLALSARSESWPSSCSGCRPISYLGGVNP